jgi:hypothetical protein
MCGCDDAGGCAIDYNGLANDLEHIEVRARKCEISFWHTSADQCWGMNDRFVTHLRRLARSLEEWPKGIVLKTPAAHAERSLAAPSQLASTTVVLPGFVFLVGVCIRFQSQVARRSACLSEPKIAKRL